jgi:hypothetical protein
LAARQVKNKRNRRRTAVRPVIPASPKVRWFEPVRDPGVAPLRPI